MVRSHFMRYLVLLALFITGGGLLAGGKQTDFLPDEIMRGRSLWSHVEYLEDPGGAWSLTEISGDGRNWLPVRKNNPAFGFTDKVYWLRFSVRNRHGNRLHWYLQQKYPLIDQLDLFQVRAGGGVHTIRLGDTHAFSDRKISHNTLVFPLGIEPGERQKIYLRVHSSSAVNLELKAWSPEEFHGARDASLPVFWLYYGFLFSLFLVNLLLFAVRRKPDFAYYAGYVLLLGLFVFSVNGFAFQYFWPDSQGWANYTIPVITSLKAFCYILFLRQFLRIKQQTKLGEWVVRLVLFLWVLSILYSVGSNDYRGSMLLTIYLSYFSLALAMPVVLYVAFIKRDRAGRFFLGAFGILTLSSLLLLSKNLGFLEHGLLSNFGFQMGSVFEVVIITWGILDKEGPVETQELKHNPVRSQDYLQGQNVPLLVTRLKRCMLQEKIYRDEDLNLNGLAQELEISSHQLSQLLNDRVQKNFATFINDFRVREAAELLVQEPDRSILSVGYAVGFNSKSGFNLAFKRKMELTPSGFRRKHGEQE